MDLSATSLIITVTITMFFLILSIYAGFDAMAQGLNVRIWIVLAMFVGPLAISILHFLTDRKLSSFIWLIISVIIVTFCFIF